MRGLLCHRSSPTLQGRGGSLAIHGHIQSGGLSITPLQCFTLENPLFSRIVSSCSCYFNVFSKIFISATLLLHFFVSFCFILFHILKLAPNKGLSSDHTALQRRRHLGGSGISADPMALIIGLIWLDDEHVPPNTKQKKVGVLGSKVEKMSCVFSQSGPAKLFRLHWFTAFLFLANHIGGKLGK